MSEPWEDNKQPKKLSDLGYIGITKIEDGYQLLFKFSGDPVAWDANYNMEWICERLIPGLKRLASYTGEDLLGRAYGFRISQFNSDKIPPMFSIAVISRPDRQGTWSIEELTSDNDLSVWMTIDEEMIEIMNEYGEAE